MTARSSSRASSASGPATSRRWPRSTRPTTARLPTATRPRSWSSCVRVPTPFPTRRSICARRPAAPTARPIPVSPQTPTPPDAKRRRWRAVSETRVLFRGIDEPDLHTIDGYRKRGGYRSLETAFRQLEPDFVLAELEASGLRGRGGAGFSMGKKGSFLPRGDMDKYLCCNADESEPGTFKDRELMMKNPHQLIEGLIIGARAAGAN